MARLTVTSTGSAAAVFIPSTRRRGRARPRQHAWPFAGNLGGRLPSIDDADGFSGESPASFVRPSDRRSFGRDEHLQGFYPDDLSLYFAARRPGAIHTETVDHRRDCHCMATGLESYNIARSEVRHFHLRYVETFIFSPVVEPAAHPSTIDRFCLPRRPARLMAPGQEDSAVDVEVEQPIRCRAVRPKGPHEHVRIVAWLTSSPIVPVACFPNVTLQGYDLRHNEEFHTHATSFGRPKPELLPAPAHRMLRSADGRHKFARFGSQSIKIALKPWALQEKRLDAGRGLAGGRTRAGVGPSGSADFVGTTRA